MARLPGNRCGALLEPTTRPCDMEIRPTPIPLHLVGDDGRKVGDGPESRDTWGQLNFARGCIPNIISVYCSVQDLERPSELQKRISRQPSCPFHRATFPTRARRRWIYRGFGPTKSSIHGKFSALTPDQSECGPKVTCARHSRKLSWATMGYAGSGRNF